MKVSNGLDAGRQADTMHLRINIYVAEQWK